MRPKYAKLCETAEDTDHVTTTGDDIPGQLTDLNKVIAPASLFREVTTITNRTKDQVRRKPNHVKLSNIDLVPSSNPPEEKPRYPQFPHTEQTPPFIYQNQPTQRRPPGLAKPIPRKTVDRHQGGEDVPDEQPEPLIPQTPYQPSLISSVSENVEDRGAFSEASEPDNQDQEGQERKLFYQMILQASTHFEIKSSTQLQSSSTPRN